MYMLVFIYAFNLLCLVFVVYVCMFLIYIYIYIVSPFILSLMFFYVDKVLI